MNDTTALAVIPEHLAPALASRGIDAHTWNALTGSVWPGAKDESVLMAVDYCRARDLDPLKKPVHIVPMWVDDKQTGKKGMRDVVMPGIYEYRITAHRTGEYAGMDDAVFGDMIEFQGIQVPEWCRVTVHRMQNGVRCTYSHTEYYEEAYATKGRDSLAPNSMWTKRKRGQLAKCAEAGALRKAFPDEFGGTQTLEEMQGKIIDVTGTPVIEREPTDADMLNKEIAPAGPEGAAGLTPPAVPETPAGASTSEDVEKIAADFLVVIAEADSLEALGLIGEAIKKASAEVQKAVRAAYQAKGKVLTDAEKGGGAK